MVENFNLGDIVEMKKTHPCGTNNFEIIRIGADIKIKCVGCGRIVMIPRRKFQKDAKKIVAVAESYRKYLKYFELNDRIFNCNPCCTKYSR